MTLPENGQKTGTIRGYFLLGTAMAAVILAFALLVRADLRAARPLDAADYPDIVPDGLVWTCDTTLEDEYITIDGYAFITGERFLWVDNAVVLYDTRTDSYLRLGTAMVRREEATLAGGDGINYSFGGFTSFVATNVLGQDLSRYEICLAYGANHRRVLVHTGLLLTEGKGNSNG